jgi:hypothetical protein
MIMMVFVRWIGDFGEIVEAMVELEVEMKVKVKMKVVVEVEMEVDCAAIIA